jgi:hypothetical protein
MIRVVSTENRTSSMLKKSFSVLGLRNLSGFWTDGTNRVIMSVYVKSQFSRLSAIVQQKALTGKVSKIAKFAVVMTARRCQHNMYDFPGRKNRTEYVDVEEDTYVGINGKSCIMLVVTYCLGE